jgi:hypothetical protein
MRAQAWPLDAQMRMDLWKVLMNRTSLRAAVQRRNPDEFSARRFPVLADSDEPSTAGHVRSLG